MASDDDDLWPGFSGGPGRTERCLFGREEVQLPELFIEQSHIFNEVLSQDTWDNVLSGPQKKYLTKFLPTFSQNDGEEKEDTVKKLLARENFKFGNPVNQFQVKLRDGMFSPDIAKYTNLCRQYKYREYKFRQQRHYSDLLKEIILSRQRVLEEVCHLPPDQPVRFNYVPSPDKDKSMEHKVRKKFIRLLKEVREECGVEDTSSEEEESVSPVQRSRRQLFKSLGPIPSPEPTTPSVLATFASKPPTINGDIGGETPTAKSKRQRPISPVEVTEDDYRLMLRNHKRRKSENVDLPELDTQTIALQDILSRCQASKKTSKSPSGQNSQTSPVLKKKLKEKDKGEKKLKKKIKTETVESTAAPEERPSSPPVQSNNTTLEVPTDLLPRDEGGVPDFPLPDAGPSKLDNFFSLLRDMIADFPDQRVTTAKLEERVREWQESPSSSLNSWFQLQPSWVDCVVSALKFLSGDVLGLSVENFIPYLDYKERAQQWKWIGVGRDSNSQLSPLCRHWLQHKDNNTIDGLDSSQGSPPPPRAKTAFVVRPTSHEEKSTFQEQEKRRFENPHKAFMYKMHGYESVVGPVKGVYSKENAMNKAREHALLVSDRPAFVTILTLVRDAAARLPNGEGTRGDICELLKDSQFLAPGVTDTQINTVVSGALDRLHSEKDPCVKYDVNRKLWIYLHRNRTEEEFERIHQAQGAAVKAKKSLQKPKTTKTIKEAMSQPSPRPTPTLSLNVASTENTTVDDHPLPPQAMASPSVTHSPKGLAQSPYAPQQKTPQSSPKTPGASPRQGTINLGLTGSLAHMTSPGVVGSPVSHSQTNMKNTAQLLQSPPVVAQATPVSKPVTVTMVTPGTLPPGTVTAVAQTKTDTFSRTRAVELLQGQTMFRHGAAISATLGTQQVAHSIATTTKAEVLLHRPGSVVMTQAGLAVTAASTTAAKLMTLTHATSGVTTSVTSQPVVASCAADTPTVARLMQQVPTHQMVSVSNLLASGAQRLHGAGPRTTTIKIQGGSIVQPVGGGKPLHLSGKPLAQSKGLVQLGGKNPQSLGVIQTPQGTLSTISIIPQHATTAVVSLSQPKSVFSVANSSANPVTSAGLPAGTVISHPKMAVVNQPVTSAVTMPQGVQVVNQPKVVSPSQGGIVVTQLAPGSISLRPGIGGAGQAKVVSAGQAGLVPAQFIVQQTPQGIKAGGGEAGGVVTNVSQGMTATPIIVSNAGGKAGQNIQVVRTVLSQQAGLKPGQATILISQPALQQAQGTVLSSGQVIQTGTKTGGRGSPKGKPQPVYARIITPPPGMKLTTVGTGQPVPTQGMSVIQTVGKLLQNVTTSGFTPVVTSGTLATSSAPSMHILQTETAAHKQHDSVSNSQGQ